MNLYATNETPQQHALRVYEFALVGMATLPIQNGDHLQHSKGGVRGKWIGRNFP